MGRALETVVAYNTSASTTAGTYVPLTPHNAQSFAIRASDGVPAPASWPRGASLKRPGSYR